MNDLIEMHVHADPDYPANWWALDKISLVEEYRAHGYQAVLFTGNHWSTHTEAYLLSKQFPDIKVFGGLTFNFCLGENVSSFAVEKCLEDSAGEYFKCVWLPTRDADYDLRKNNRKGIPVVDAYGHVLPEVKNLMAVCKENDLILATGHCGPDNAVLLSAQAKKIGLKKLVVTQSTLSPRKLSMDQAQACLEKGAYLEHVVLSAYKGKGNTQIPVHQMHEFVSEEEISRYILIEPERQFVASDMNQLSNPNPILAMADFRKKLEAYLPENVMDKIFTAVPSYLLAIS